MKKGLPLIDDTDLQKRRAKDDYHVQRILKFFGLFVFIMVVIVLGFLFIQKCVNDHIFQNAVMEIIKQNLSGIFFFGFSLMGIKYISNK